MWSRGRSDKTRERARCTRPRAQRAVNLGSPRRKGAGKRALHRARRCARRADSGGSRDRTAPRGAPERDASPWRLAYREHGVVVSAAFDLLAYRDHDGVRRRFEQVEALAQRRALDDFDAPPDAPAHWVRAIEALPGAPVLRHLVHTLRSGIADAASIGERLLEGSALSLWDRALIEAPPGALDTTLSRLRVDDGLEPEASIV